MKKKKKQARLGTYLCACVSRDTRKAAKRIRTAWDVDWFGSGHVGWFSGHWVDGRAGGREDWPGY